MSFNPKKEFKLKVLQYYVDPHLLCLDVLKYQCVGSIPNPAVLLWSQNLNLELLPNHGKASVKINDGSTII